MNRLTAKEIANRFGVSKQVAQKWIQRALFPNAYKEKIEPFGEIWFVPESDVNSFAPPKPGRPRSENPTKSAIAKRDLRDQEKKTT